MSEYLDAKGLEHFWGGVKSYVDYNTINNGMYSVVKTSAEFNSIIPTVGTMVYVIEEDKTYQFTPTGWSELKTSARGDVEDDKLVKSVENIEERNALTPIIGMLCYVSDEDNTYQYTLAGWNLLKVSTGTTVVTEESYFKTVETIEERDALIPLIGMMCYVIDDDKTYQYGTGGWSELSGNGGGSSSIPTLSYTDEFPEGQKISVNKGDTLYITVRFESTTYGNCTIDIYKDNVNIKSVTSPKGNITLNLGKITAEGTYKYRITGRDKLEIPVAEDLSFTVICGGITLSSDFSVVSATKIYEEGNDIPVNYSVSCSDTGSIVNIAYTLTNTSNQIVKSGVVNTQTYSTTSKFTMTSVPAGSYILRMIAYTGDSETDATNENYVSVPVTYDFIVLTENGIGISSTFDSSDIDQYTNINIPFKMVKNNTSRLIMRGALYILDGSNKELVKQTSGNGISVQVNVQSYWFIGKINPGEYYYELTAYTEDFLISSETISDSFTVIEGTQDKQEYVKTNCIAYFDANSMSNTDETKEIWKNSITTNSQYAIQLHSLNYSSNGWMTVDENDGTSEHYLKLNGESWGELVDLTQTDSDGNYVQIKPLDGFNSATEGFALEVLFRTRCVGELDFRALTCQDGIDVATPGISITYDNLYISSNSKNAYLGFSEDEWIHAVFVIDRNIRTTESVGGLSNIENINPVNTMRIYINGVLCSCEAAISDSFVNNLGEAFPLFLNTALNSNDQHDYFGECEFKLIRIYNSYLTSTQVLQNYIASQYSAEDQQTLLDKNNLANNTTLPIVTFKKKKNSEATDSVNHTNFAFLNTITDKSVSKKSCVDCVCEIQYPDGTITTLENVDVYLQGTSSLQYPIKNYKIKLFTDAAHTKKNKIKLQDHEDWEKESTFTLKCDYMESSHLNNTPLADLYNQLIETLGGKSPAREYNELNEGHYMRDAVDGFPVIVYFTDDPDDEDQLTLVGSYMFNIDKAGDTLGFKVPVYERDDNGGFLSDQPLTWQGNQILDDDGNPVLDDDGNPTYETLVNVMQSYEGTANSPTYSAGCFYSYEDSIPHMYQEEVEDEYNSAYETYCKSTDNPVSLEEYKAAHSLSELGIPTYEEYAEEHDKYSYVADDFEPRYDYAEDDENEEKTYNAMYQLIEGVANAEKTDTFREYFIKHFDLTYALVYYLQMIVFAQVDNAGKNSMWDTWDGDFWYIRPYDMDTSMGLSNSGTETISVDAEMLRDNSPYSSNASEYSTNSEAELRYRMYNTQTSKVWNNFAKEFADEIKTTYQSLRQTIYTMDNLYEHFTSYTVDKIPEIIYNKDMAAKYLTQVDSNDQTYLKMLHGNRIQKFKQFLRQRLDFCDSLYEYTTTYTTDDNINSTITLRADAFNANQSATKSCIGIETYTPQYITVSVGSSRDYLITAYVGPDSTYTDPFTGETVSGTLFSFSVRGSDKEITINGAGGIKNLHYLADLDVRDLTIGNASKIIELDINGSTRMTQLTMGNNKYLRELDVSNSKMLGTASGGNGLSLIGCTALKKLDVSNTQLTSVTLASGSPLKEINFSYTLINSMLFENMEFLEKITATGCETITSYSFTGCSAIKTFSIASTNIQKLYFTDCSSLKSLNISYCESLQQLSISGCDALEELYCNGITGSIANNLQLYTLYSLKKIDISDSSVQTLRLPKYASQDVASNVASGNLEEENAAKYSSLIWINASNSELSSIQYGSVEAEDPCVDMSQLTNLSYCNFYECKNIVKIKNIKYVGATINNLFQSCTNLVSISGLIGTRNSYATGVFYSCKKLVNADELSYSMPNVTNVTNFFSGCDVTFTALKNLFDACGGSLIDISNVFVGNDDCGGTMPSDLFSNTPNITTIDNAFSECGVKAIPQGTFDNLTKLKSAKYAFYGCSNLAIVYTDIFRKNTELTTLTSAFENCSSLTFNDSINTAFTDFFKNNVYLTDISRCFYSCSALEVKDNEFGLFLTGLTELENCSYLFYGCYKLGGTIPDGIFAGCTSLLYAQGMFAQCVGNGEVPITIPTLLARLQKGDENTVPIIRLSGMFDGCSKTTGYVSPYLFMGMPDLTDVGYYSGGASYPELQGMFANTAISQYHESLFAPLTKLTNVQGFFRNCSKLTSCLYGNDNEERQNSVTLNLFRYNTALRNTSYMFYGCTSLRGCLPSDSSGESIFFACKNALTTVAGMFANCTMLDGINKEDNTYVGIPSKIFTNCVSLTNTSSFMSGCTSYNMSIPEGLFSGCTMLYNTSNMFYKCTSLVSRATSCIPVSLFNNCRDSISIVNSMFAECTNLNNYMPEADSNTSDSKGLFEDCTLLQNVDNFFYNCSSIKGSIPSDMFKTSSNDSKFVNIKSISGLFYGCSSLDEAYYDKDNDIYYICDPDIFVKLPNVTNASNLFENVSGITNCQVPATLFDNQTSLENVTNAFHNSGIVGEISDNFLRKSLGSLTNASYLFSNTGITTVSNSFLRLGASIANTRLKYVAGIFANCTSTTGTAPALWNKTLYPKIDTSRSGYYAAFINTHFTNVIDSEGNVLIEPTDWVS